MLSPTEWKLCCCSCCCCCSSRSVKPSSPTHCEKKLPLKRYGFVLICLLSCFHFKVAFLLSILQVGTVPVSQVWIEGSELPPPLFFLFGIASNYLQSGIKGYEADLCKCYRPHHHLILCGQAVLPTMSHYRFLSFLQLKMHSFHPLFLSTGQLQSKKLSHFLFLHALPLWSVYLWGCLCVIVLCSYVTLWPAEATGGRQAWREMYTTGVKVNRSKEKEMSCTFKPLMSMLKKSPDHD